MTSYIPKPGTPKERGKRGDDRFLKHFEGGHEKIRTVIANIEDTNDESTLLALEEYIESGIPVIVVSSMLRHIRMDLLEADRELYKAAEILYGKPKKEKATEDKVS